MSVQPRECHRRADRRRARSSSGRGRAGTVAAPHTSKAAAYGTTSGRADLGRYTPEATRRAIQHLRKRSGRIPVRTGSRGPRNGLRGHVSALRAIWAKPSAGRARGSRGADRIESRSQPRRGTPRQGRGGAQARVRLVHGHDRQPARAGAEPEPRASAFSSSVPPTIISVTSRRHSSRPKKVGDFAAPTSLTRSATRASLRSSRGTSRRPGHAWKMSAA